MSLPHALLTALLERPCSGLELSSRFDRSIGHFWSATHQQIYRELARLEKAGWVSSERVASGRGRKKTYTVLPAGKRALKAWLDEQEDPQPTRDPLLLRLRAAASIGPGKLAHEILRHQRLHQDKLAHFQALATKPSAKPIPPAQARIFDAILQAGIEREALWVACCEQALQALQDSDAPTPAPDQPGTR